MNNTSWLKPYALVIVNEADYRYAGQVISYPTPDNTIMVRRIPDDPSTMEEMTIIKLSKPTGKYKYVHYAEVNGKSYFPVDMLRYDFAAPVNFKLDDRCNVICNEDKLFIAQASDVKRPRWTPARWASFGWTVAHLRTLKIENK